jgi:hypothetical protein
MASEAPGFGRSAPGGAFLDTPLWAAGIAGIAAIAGAYYLFTSKRTSKRTCPGPRGYPFIGKLSLILDARVHTHIHTHTIAHIVTHTHTHSYTHTLSHKHTYTFTHTHTTRTDTCTHNTHTHTCTHVHIHNTHKLTY